MTLRVGILGAAGYTGAELIRLIDLHPELELVWLAAKDNAGQKLSQVLPFTQGVSGIGDMDVESFEETDAKAIASKLDVVFTALPHAASARLGGALLDAGVQVVDLSADFRLRDLDVYQRWYGKHPRPELIAQAVYGLVELYREQLNGARLIAGPGCFPTSAILPLAPLFREGLIQANSPAIVDSKSGASGAGRKPLPNTTLAETAEGIRPYKVAGTHRHTPEMEQELSLAAQGPIRVLFTPQLAPMIRGILSTCYVSLKPGVSEEQCRLAAQQHLTGDLISILAEGSLPDTLHVRGSGRAQVGYALDKRTGLLVAMCSIDNLARGASSQAIAALNVSRGLSESAGIPRLAQFP